MDLHPIDPPDPPDQPLYNSTLPEGFGAMSIVYTQVTQDAMDNGRVECSGPGPGEYAHKLREEGNDTEDVHVRGVQEG